MRAILAVIFWVVAWPLAAAELPKAVLNKLQADPERFLDLAVNLIHGFGTGQGIDRAGVDRFVALERAAARASALRRLAVADLDFDGSVTRAEMEVLAAAASAKSRGRLWQLFERADGDADGTITAAETLGFGQVEALAGFGLTEEAAVRAILAFDADSNGRVTLEEVKAALAALAT